MPNPSDLKNSGLKATLPRLKILEIFQNAASAASRHMTAEDVYRELKNHNVDTGLATVYRVLAQFESAGLLSRRQFESGKAVFELNEGEHHDHLICTDCGRVVEFHDDEIERRQEVMAEQLGFRLREHSLALYAACRDEDCPHRRQ